MPLKPIAIVIALLALAGALWLLVATIRGRRWWSRAFLVVPALCLLGLVAVLVPYIFGLNAPHAFFNAPAPVPDTASVYSWVGTGLDVDGPRLIAVNARTGQQRWQDSPAVHGTFFTQDDTMLYAVAYHAGGASLYAVNGATGATAWHEDLPNVFTQSAAAIVDGTLVLGVQDYAGGKLGLQQLYAFRPSDGHQLWHVSVGEKDFGSLQVSGGSGLVITHLDNDVVQAWGISDGHQVWDAPRFDGQIVVGANDVFELTTDGSVIAISIRTGTVSWQSRVPGDLRAGVIEQNTIYVTAQRDDTNASGLLIDPVKVYAFDVATGHLLWRFATKSVDAGTLVASAQGVYVDVDEGIYALRPSDGKLLWRNDRGGWRLLAGFSPFVGQVFYVSLIEAVPSQRFPQLGQQGQTYLYALDQHTGSPYWKVPIGPLVTTHGLLMF
jgi:outer membrane protein assembly factor BamB